MQSLIHQPSLQPTFRKSPSPGLLTLPATTYGLQSTNRPVPGLKRALGLGSSRVPEITFTPASSPGILEHSPFELPAATDMETESLNKNESGELSRDSDA
jgi:hypothetical protein